MEIVKMFCQCCKEEVFPKDVDIRLFMITGLCDGCRQKLTCPNCKNLISHILEKHCGAYVCGCGYHVGLERCFCGWSRSGQDGRRELEEMGETIE